LPQRPHCDQLLPSKTFPPLPGRFTEMSRISRRFSGYLDTFRCSFPPPPSLPRPGLTMALSPFLGLGVLRLFFKSLSRFLPYACPAAFFFPFGEKVLRFFSWPLFSGQGRLPSFFRIFFSRSPFFMNLVRSASVLPQYPSPNRGSLFSAHEFPVPVPSSVVDDELSFSFSS